MGVLLRKRGNNWEYRFEVAPIDGKRKWIVKGGFKTKDICQEEGIKVYNKYNYTGVPYQECDMSYADFLDKWIKEYAEVNLKYHTIMTYKNVIKNHLKPKLGYYKLSQLNSVILNEFMTKLYVDNSYSKWYMRGILKNIKASFRYACDDLNFIPYNPALKVHVPKYDTEPSDPTHIFTKEEIEKILDRFKNSHTIYYALLTAYFTGLRLGEVFGLTWDNIDFKNQTLTVNKNLVKRNQEGTSHNNKHNKGASTAVWYLGTCKTQTSYRTISISKKLIDGLKLFKEEQEENKKLYGDSYIKHYIKEVNNIYTNKLEKKIISASTELPVSYPECNFIFVRENGYFLGTDQTKYAMKVIHYELGINCRFHDFRDTHATKLIEAGSDIKAVSKRLGHSTIQTTYNIYVRVTNKMESDTVERFDEYTNDLDI